MKTKEERCAYIKDYNKRPEVIIRNRNWSRDYHRKPEIIARQKAYMEIPEVKAKRKIYEKTYRMAHPEKLKEKNRNWRLRPDNVEKMKDPKYKAQISEYKRNLYNQKKLLPEFKEKMKERHLIREYGLTMVEYKNLLSHQNFKCAICGTQNWGKRQPYVDHDHKTGIVRGILCQLCNVALGCMRDDKKTAMNMVAYLEKHEVKNVCS